MVRAANNDKQRRHRTATSRAMKRVAENRRCKNCGRANATRRNAWLGSIIITCIYCGDERAVSPK